MSSNKSVVVLAPNGRRQNVKVTPNTTILQVLEEVCQKHRFNPDDYDLKHYNKVLDVNAILRFTGLANNALLEMVPCTKARPRSDVTIGLQLEDGQRLTAEFSPSASLADILRRSCPDRELDRAVVIYMHREIYGSEALEGTTLKLLGLTGGRAMLRLMFRDPEQLKTQASVGVPLLPKIQPPPDNPIPGTSSVDPAKAELAGSRPTEAKVTRTEEPEPSRTKEPIRTEGMEEAISSVEKAYQRKQSEVAKLSEPCIDDTPNYQEIEFLGERNALVYSQEAMATGVGGRRDELPDNFYDLTVNDARILLRDAKRRREELEEAPLLTDAQRQLDREKRMLGQLRRYRCTLIRILFPDQYVLQGVFTPLETVERIDQFVRKYLEDPGCDFTIYTAPPKRILDKETRLLEADLVPSAVVHYSGLSPLKTDVKERAVEPRAAEFHAIKARLETIRQEEEDEDQQDKDKDKEKRQPTSHSREERPSSSKAVPKWFGLSSK